MTNGSNFSWPQALEALSAEFEGNPQGHFEALRDAALRHRADGVAVDLIARTLVSLPQSDAPHRVAVLGNQSTFPVTASVHYALLLEGVRADVHEGAFGSLLADVLDTQSAFHAFGSETTVLAPSTLDLQPHLSQSGPDTDPASAIEVLTASWEAVWETLGSSGSRVVLQHVFEEPDEELLGRFEREAPWSPSAVVRRLNATLYEAAPSFVRWIDTRQLANRVGRRNWWDPRLRHHAKAIFNPRHSPEYAAVFASAWRQAHGRAKKGIVVDLDNTLWGGVIGDDGLEGIVLGPTSAAGEAYSAFCDYLVQLSARGVVLAICSKNDLDPVQAVFTEHPHMALNLEHFGAVECSWDDKATGIRRIAADLNLGLDSLVFVDDNPAECELVRRELREVRVVELPRDPAQFVRIIDDAHWFDQAQVTDVDSKRTTAYAARRRAKELQTASASLDDYLSALDMTTRVDTGEGLDFVRLAQMEGKTNQFNLTTRRRTEDEIRAVAADPLGVVWAFSLRDRFADHGVVAYVAAEITDPSLTITDWIMSCRVFSRGLEFAVIAEVLAFAKDHGVSKVIGMYRSTARNHLVADLYERLGFSRSEGGDESTWWIDVESAEFPAHHIKVVTDE